ncbi:MAG: transporter [Gemmatimonadaceae bacterium]
MRRFSLPFFALLFIGSTSTAQESSPPIQDNSFLIEEAYNQEPGVVQHVLLFARDRATRDWALAFTQEWPLASQNHQLSYTVPLVRAGANRGIGDVAVNYRYRWLAGERSESVIRLSALLPTGSSERGLGAGGAGVQINLPLSLEIGRAIAAHWNMGGSVIPSARAEDGTRSSASELFAGASVIWLVHPALNLLAESIWSRAKAPGIGGTRTSETTLTLVPGVRGAINLRSGAQIVPGVGLMLDAEDGARVSGLLLYLSFEHAFGGAN